MKSNNVLAKSAKDRTLDDLVYIENEIASTQNVTVSSGFYMDPSIPVAIKKLKTRDERPWFSTDTDSSLVKDLNNEMDILDQIAHPNIVKYYGYMFSGENPCIIMDLLAYSLEDVLLKSNILNERSNMMAAALQAKVALSIAYALEYLHHNKIVHADLKLANVLTNEDFSAVKVCDFGLSQDTTKNTSQTEWSRGTLVWLSPEIAQYTIDKNIRRPDAPKDPYKIDMWPFGHILLQFLINTNATPYNHLPPKTTDYALFLLIAAGNHHPIPPAKPLSELIIWCLQKDPAKRPSATEAIDAICKLQSKNNKKPC